MFSDSCVTLYLRNKKYRICKTNKKFTRTEQVDSNFIKKTCQEVSRNNDKIVNNKNRKL